MSITEEQINRLEKAQQAYAEAVAKAREAQEAERKAEQAGNEADADSSTGIF